MHRVSDDAARFNRMLAQLSERLAARDIVVSTLHADWSDFGCWELQVERGSEAERYSDGIRGPDPMRAIGPEVLRFFWDGQDRYLKIEASPTRPLSAPNEWEQQHAQAFDTSEEAVQYIEEYLKQRFQHDSPKQA